MIERKVTAEMFPFTARPSSMIRSAELLKLIDNPRECTASFCNTLWSASCLDTSSKSIANVFTASLFIIVSVTRLATAFSASLSERATTTLNDVMYHVNNTYTTAVSAVVMAISTDPNLKNTEETNAISKNVGSKQKTKTFITMLRLEIARVNLAVVSPVCVVAWNERDNACKCANDRVSHLRDMC